MWYRTVVRIRRSSRLRSYTMAVLIQIRHDLHNRCIESNLRYKIRFDWLLPRPLSAPTVVWYGRNRTVFVYSMELHNRLKPDLRDHVMTLILYIFQTSTWFFKQQLEIWWSDAQCRANCNVTWSRSTIFVCFSRKFEISLEISHDRLGLGRRDKIITLTI